MGRGPKKRVALEEILASTSDVIFPAEFGEQPVTIENTDCDGDTPLHVMIWRNDRYAVDLLIEAGANIDAVGDMSQTPLHVAVGQEDLPIIEVLLKAGSKNNIRSEFNETAAERAKRRVVKLKNILTSLYAPNHGLQGMLRFAAYPRSRSLYGK